MQQALPARPGAGDFSRMESDHAEILSALSSLTNATDSDFPKAFRGFLSIIEQEFRNEERLMEQVGVASFQSHLEEHARILGTLHQLVPRVDIGDLHSGRCAIDLLLEWFPVHVAIADTVLAEACGRTGDPLSPSQE